MSTRQNQWFVPGDGIAREVITADIQRYLGPDALVRPGTGTGEYEGRPGYWITAYRTLTSQMIQDLKADSQRWQTERDGGRGRGVDYRDSRTHAARQEWGPSESYASQSRETHSRTPHTAAYADTGHYTTSPTAPYPSHPAGYTVPQPAYAVQPRTDPYAGYAQVPGQHPSYPAAQAYPTYTQTPAPDPYRTPAPPPNYTTAPRQPVAPPGYYIASDGRQYPLSQRPTNGSSR
ncbi:uncharacterized protein EI97DRAFT_213594 [Westerdykella ornata]|uniref:Uncharacterized protein n=1 Tax=Westerdykella ornata TaxID=318751 RepID=A0A6A6J8A5_WESOR|nr:uncharacterized protein EI97DRAFT_213594 [Westerdykella ornata]KAF2272393.1 hypothetical protein EI97DRAFT_213594 [Westerdykella ornata]